MRMVLLEEVIIIRVTYPNSGFIKQLLRIIPKLSCETSSHSSLVFLCGRTKLKYRKKCWTILKKESMI